MTELIFKDPDEARAWDMYVTKYLDILESSKDAIDGADQVILERRKRMAPEKVERLREELAEAKAGIAQMEKQWNSLQDLLQTYEAKCAEHGIQVIDWKPITDEFFTNKETTQ